MSAKTTVQFNKGEIKMIAHRGLSGLERENTCPAFVAAGVKSYYGIETDVLVQVVSFGRQLAIDYFFQLLRINRLRHGLCQLKGYTTDKQR